MHLGHWHRATRLTKTDADISVGGRLQWLSRWQLPGAASCLYDEVTNTATVVDSHWLPAQTGLYVDGYQPVPGVPRSPAGGSSLTAASQVGTWKWNPGADLWTSDASWSSAFAPLVWPRGVSRHSESWAVLDQVEGGGSLTNFRLGRCSVWWRKKKSGQTRAKKNDFFCSLEAKANITGIICAGYNGNTTWFCFMKMPRLHENSTGNVQISWNGDKCLVCVCVCVVEVF